MTFITPLLAHLTAAHGHTPDGRLEAASDASTLAVAMLLGVLWVVGELRGRRMGVDRHTAAAILAMLAAAGLEGMVDNVPGLPGALTVLATAIMVTAGLVVFQAQVRALAGRRRRRGGASP